MIPQTNAFLKLGGGLRGIAGRTSSVGISFLRRILGKRGVRTNLEFLVETILEDNDNKVNLPENALHTARAIENFFIANHILPNRIAVDGVPGSGKSTLAKALAARLDMKAVCLDHYDMDRPVSFASTFAIFEHHRLLRTQDIECFDALIHIDQPVTVSRQNILKRKRGAYLVDIMDFDRLKIIGEKAFSLADGQAVSMDKYVRLKTRPAKGFNDRRNLARELREKGFTRAGLNKEQQIFLSVTGTARKGFTAYLNTGAYKQEFVAALLEGMAGRPRRKR